MIHVQRNLRLYRASPTASCNSPPRSNILGILSRNHLRHPFTVAITAYNPTQTNFPRLTLTAENLRSVHLPPSNDFHRTSPLCDYRLAPHLPLLASRPSRTAPLTSRVCSRPAYARHSSPMESRVGPAYPRQGQRLLKPRKPRAHTGGD